MYNDRDDKYEGNEDSEYHFSDDEVSYEVETESTKPASPITVQKEGLLTNLTRSKRMLISLGVFFVLVFIVYKMVAPSSPTTPQTDITAPVVAQQQQQTAQQRAIPRNAPTIAQQQPVATVPVQQPTMTTPTQAAQQPVMATPPVEAPASMVATAPTQIPAAAQTSSTAMTMSQPTVSSMPAAAPQSMPMNQQPGAPAAVQTAQSAPVASIPTVIPVQSPAAYNANTNQPIGTVPTAPATMPSAQPIATMDANIARVTTQSDQLVNQLRAEYAQKVNDYANQNKALQDQVQTLNTRVATMETELGQLVQALIRQSGSSAANGSTATTNAPAAQPAQPQAAVDIKSPYNVQAIIPGRAWLRSDNGETITVAEGDMIKELGRVTKIDPYDGVVEINTGNKMMSLSYGNGG